MACLSNDVPMTGEEGSSSLALLDSPRTSPGSFWPRIQPRLESLSSPAASHRFTSPLLTASYRFLSQRVSFPVAAPRIPAQHPRPRHSPSPREHASPHAGYGSANGLSVGYGSANSLSLKQMSPVVQRECRGEVPPPNGKSAHMLRVSGTNGLRRGR